MEYKDELRLRLIQAGIEPTEDIIRFIDLETIPLKANLFEQDGLIMGSIYYLNHFTTIDKVDTDRFITLLIDHRKK